MPDTADWRGRTGEVWAQEWRRTDRSFALLTERLLQELRGVRFSDALDIGCGAGELSLAIARGSPESRVTGIDIAPDLIAAARERSSESSNTEFLIADASVWRPDPSHRPQLMMSRHGVMFFDDPVRAFSNLRVGAEPGAKLAFSCFQSAKKNDWMMALSDVLGIKIEPNDQYGPGPFSFGDGQVIEEILAGSSWSDVKLEPFEYAMIFGSGPDAVAEAVTFFARIGPAARALAEIEGQGAKQEVLVRLQRLADERCTDNLVAMPAAAWIVTAKA